MRKSIAVIIVVAALICSFACAEEAAEFSFRSGISFGMSWEDIMLKEHESVQVRGDDWESQWFGNWLIMGTDTKVKVSKYEAYLYYLLADDQMRSAVYDIYDTPDDITDAFDYITNALSSVYGEAEAAPASEALGVTDAINPGFYQESDLRHTMKWQTAGVLIYQFYYDDHSFVIWYLDPNFDMSEVNGGFNTDGL